MQDALINLQRGNNSCCVIKENDSNNLKNAVFMDSRISDLSLFGAKRGNPIFKEKIDYISNKGEIGYFVITNFDLLPIEEQNKYIPLIKDREFLGYTLPENIIIVLTVKDKDTLKNISSKVYHFCVVLI